VFKVGPFIKDDLCLLLNEVNLTPQLFLSWMKASIDSRSALTLLDNLCDSWTTRTLRVCTEARDADNKVRFQIHSCCIREIEVDELLNVAEDEGHSLASGNDVVSLS
jgi:hypothetical protein